jgi:hypothetical protein
MFALFRVFAQNGKPLSGQMDSNFLKRVRACSRVFAEFAGGVKIVRAFFASSRKMKNPFPIKWIAVFSENSHGCGSGLLHLRSTPPTQNSEGWQATNLRSRQAEPRRATARGGTDASTGRTKMMMNAKDAVVWTHQDTKDVMVRPQAWGCPEDRGRGGGWGDPIGAAYSQWGESTDKQRVTLMVETAIDLAMQGFDLKTVLVQFCNVRQFRALGGESYPMCRALTSALIGRCLDPNTMSFEELLETYAAEPV